ncbi:DUF1697 domain-containing protein [Microbacterium sp. BWT-B31]|uniref:DUF1697 domain-containing protein n=1 Tax=Microbacterium sp. BWT-B31 TaxID=3232072 RepID=UPI0035294ED7
MSVWIALLRGVNVGGAAIRSAELAEVFRGLGFDGVRTVLASGNVRFQTATAPADRAHLKRRIESALGERFGYEAWIVLITQGELQAAIDRFPFDAGDATRQPWVVFCSDEASRGELAEAAASLDDTDADRVVFARASRDIAVVYWNPRTGTTTDTPFAKVLSKSRFKATTTNRSLRTLAKLVG